MKRLLCGLLLFGCAETPPVIEGPAPAQLASAAPARQPRAPGQLFRDEVNATVDAGFPRFLQKVRVEPELVDGKFSGWIVRGLQPPEFWAGVDLEPGDVVTQVNGKPIERETEAFAVFQSLKTAPRLQVSVMRQGLPHPLDYEIVERPRQ